MGLVCLLPLAHMRPGVLLWILLLHNNSTGSLLNFLKQMYNAFILGGRLVGYSQLKELIRN